MVPGISYRSRVTDPVHLWVDRAAAPLPWFTWFTWRRTQGTFQERIFLDPFLFWYVLATDFILWVWLTAFDRTGDVVLCRYRLCYAPFTIFVRGMLCWPVNHIGSQRIPSDAKRPSGAFSEGDPLAPFSSVWRPPGPMSFAVFLLPWGCVEPI